MSGRIEGDGTDGSDLHLPLVTWPELLRWVAAFGLPTRIVPQDLTGRAQPLVGAIVAHKLQGIAPRALRSCEAHIGDDVMLALERLAVMGQLSVPQLENALVDTAQMLAANGVPFRVLKGAALARTLYDDPAERYFSDVDLLVRSSDFDRVTDLLESQGARRVRGEPRRGFTSRFLKGVAHVRTDGVAIDLHRTLLDGPISTRVDEHDLFADAATIEVAGHRLPILTREMRFLHACFHAGLGDIPPRLGPMRDLALSAYDDELDFERVVAVARRWRVDSVVAFALRRAAAALALEDATCRPLEWARSARVAPDQQAMVELYFARDHSYRRRNFVVMVREIASFRDKARFVLMSFFPSSEYLRRRNQSIASRIGASLRGLAGRP